MNQLYSRKGSFKVGFSKTQVFHLLCPKMEEKWIPNWKCQVIYSKTGYNETGAIFKTEKALGTQLIWFTNMFDIVKGRIEFTCFSDQTLVFNFVIQINEISNLESQLAFNHTFIALNKAGADLIKTYRLEDFDQKLSALGKLMEQHLINITS
jgi:hypothetical protein